MQQLARWLPGRSFICVGDSGYAVLGLLAATRAQTSWLTRLRLDVALFEPAPARVAGQLGRPRVKGARLPGLAQVAAAASTRWQALTLPADARGQARPVEVATGTALWYSAGIGVPIRWVLVRAAGTPAAPLSAFLSTDLTLEAATIVTTYAQRWALELTFAQVRAHLGVETQRQWTDLAIARTTPVLLGLFSLVTLLAARLHERACYGRKPVPSTRRRPRLLATRWPPYAAMGGPKLLLTTRPATLSCLKSRPTSSTSGRRP